MIFQLILVQVVTLAFIIFIFRQVFYRHTSHTLSNLQGLYQDNLQKQEVLKDEISKTETFRDQEMAKAREDAEAIISAAKSKALLREDEIIQDAREQAKVVINKANIQLRREHAQLLESVQAQAMKLSQGVLYSVLSDNLIAAVDDQLQKELLNELQNTEFAKKLQPSEGELKIEIVSSHQINEENKKHISDLLSKGLNKNDLVFDFKIDKGTLGGLIINLEGKVIDGSLSNRLRKALTLIQEKE